MTFPGEKSGYITWSWTRIKREKLVATCFDCKSGTALPMEGILYYNRDGAPLTGLAVEETFANLGVGASLLGVVQSRRQIAMQQHRKRSASCLNAEKKHIFAATKDIIQKVLSHQ